MDAPTWKSPDTMCNTLATKINPDSTLAQISNQITKIVYGQSIISTAHYMYTRSINLPDRPHAGDNVWHSDRYLPSRFIGFDTKSYLNKTYNIQDLEIKRH